MNQHAFRGFESPQSSVNISKKTTWRK